MLDSPKFENHSSDRQRLREVFPVRRRARLRLVLSGDLWGCGLLTLFLFFSYFFGFTYFFFLPFFFPPSIRDLNVHCICLEGFVSLWTLQYADHTTVF